MTVTAAPDVGSSPRDESRAPERLGFGRKFGYGVGDLGFGLLFLTASQFLLYYYTDVAGISAAAVGTMFLVVRLWDAFGSWTGR